MRALIQRVSEASVTVGDEVVGAIGPGLLVFVGAGRGDGEEEVTWLVRKICGLRIFEDDGGRMNLSVRDVDGALLVVSQFTLYGDCRKGRRPSFVAALEPEAAEALVDRFVALARGEVGTVETGRFRAPMKVGLVNDGPVTLWLDTERPA